MQRAEVVRCLKLLGKYHDGQVWFVGFEGYLGLPSMNEYIMKKTRNRMETKKPCFALLPPLDDFNPMSCWSRPITWSS